MGVHMKQSIMRGKQQSSFGKQGIVLANLLFWAAFLGIGGILTAPVIGGISDTGLVIASYFSSSDSEGAFNDEQLATFQNSFLAGIQEVAHPNGTTYVMRHLYPLASEDVDLSIGLLLISYDSLSNAVGFINFTDIQTGGVNNRSFFVTINSNSTAVDPLNHTNCLVLLAEEEYICSFPFRVDEKLAPGGIFNEVDILSSRTNHHRQFDTIYIAPKSRATTTGDSIILFYFDQSKILASLGSDILIATYYFLIVGLAVGGILLLFITLKEVFRGIKGGGDSGR